MDWSKIKSLTEFEARSIVKDYFKKHGFTCKEIVTKGLPPGKKSPDFIVSENNRLLFYCEVKTPEHKLNPATNMYHWDTIFYKLRRFLHTAKKQFEDYDSGHKHPWVVAFTSNHPQLNWTNFVHNIIGAVAYDGKVIRDFRQKSFLKDSNKDLLSLEIILWFQVSYTDKRIYQMKHFVNRQSKLFNEAKKISDLLTPYKNEKISS